MIYYKTMHIRFLAGIRAVSNALACRTRKQTFAIGGPSTSTRLFITPWNTLELLIRDLGEVLHRRLVDLLPDEMELAP